MSFNLLKDVVELLTKLKLNIATCESVTGGMIGSQIVNTPGASKIYLGGFITYATESKIKIAGVNNMIIDDHGVVSAPCALAMAKGAKNKFNSQVALAITGEAGPQPSGDQPIGTAYLCIILVDVIYQYKLTSTKKERNDIRIDFCYQALNQLFVILKDIKE